MFVITQHYTRPGADGIFHTLGDSHKSYIQSAYRNTNKLLSTEINFDEVNKTLIVVNRWASEADFNEHRQDPAIIAILAERESYNTANGITMSFRGTHEEVNPV